MTGCTAAETCFLLQFLGWDQVSRNHVSQFPANYTGNTIVANEFAYNVTNQTIYNANGVHVSIAFHLAVFGSQMQARALQKDACALVSSSSMSTLIYCRKQLKAK